MNKIKVLIAIVLTTLSLSAAAQYSQLGSKNEFMFKAELGYAPFMGNTGTPGDNGYILQNYSAPGLNLMAGINISQDWFLGGGVGANYYLNFSLPNAESMLGANVFVDFDFRPIWKGTMTDYQPVTIKLAPLIGARLGGSLLLADQGGFTPMAECYGGINWYYAHGLRNMAHNWHSLYATIGVAYMQQTIFLPIRIGWRW